MARQTRMRTKSQDGATEILVLVNHPMETGQRTDPKTKEKIPAHFIQKMTFSLNGKEVAVADLGVAVSKDPLVGVRVKNAKAGDKVKVTWSDNKGETGEAETTVR
ncbi:sulfur oxidation protein SoxZ [Sulfurifustis variabilis]|uniref:Sulfur oxidation protein SoxZ n=1 Tax=Sulfurifustis variabilis TaxID=1675686 RepID=A0A1B4V7P6_9GAMM|nr:thiosulfate oxidation carrier complex protein SoxZ [Sulfurifustis variabilis]BAU49549.1 sulfur oxidation protein SoxZ [Sulfurifustis variabilis]